MVFYRKYRPQTLDELIGQPVVKETLQQAVQTNHLAHAYLFCGPRGTGKTSTARILAKIVNCEKVGSMASGVGRQSKEEKSPNAERPTLNLPCNQCPTCLSITDGSNLDVIEMDAASNRGIEDIRTLRDNIKLAPAKALKKVYIIDEVHMLTGDAFNALLKTLEEPPKHVLFILATTESQKIPVTILSRVERLDFRLASTDEIVADLKNITEAEKIEVEKAALLALAKLSGGSFRDAEKFLDQLAAFGKITLQVVEKYLGGGVFKEVLSLLESLAGHETTKALDKLNTQLGAGESPKELNILLLGILRKILLIKNNLGEKLVKDELSSEEYSQIQALADKFESGQVMTALEQFQESLENARFASIPSLPLEMAIVESSGLLVRLACLSADRQDRQAGGSETENNQRTKKLLENKYPIAEIVSSSTVDTQKTSVSPNSQLPASPAFGPALTRLGEAGVASPKLQRGEPTPYLSDITKINDRWVYLLETVKQDNYSLGALLSLTKVVSCDEKKVVMEVPYTFHKRIIEAPKSKNLLESLFSDILERPVGVLAVLGQKPAGRDEIANVEVAADDEIVRLAAEIFNSENAN